MSAPLVAGPCQAIRDVAGNARAKLTQIGRRAPVVGELVLAAVHDLTELTCRVTELETHIAALRMIGEISPAPVIEVREDPRQLELAMPAGRKSDAAQRVPTNDRKMAAANDHTLDREEEAV